MHRTLKEDTASPPAFSLQEQQHRLDKFRRCFNFERPHEALGFATPASVYVPSAKKLPARIPPLTYDDGFVVRRVRTRGDQVRRRANIRQRSVQR